MNSHPRLLPLLLLAAACTVGPDYAAPQPTAAAWPAADRDAPRPDGAPTDLAAPWRAFGDATLDSLETRALAGNHDVKATLARVRAARALAAAAGSARWPRVELAASYSDSRLSEHGFLEGLATGGGGGGGAIQPGQRLDLHQVEVDAAWELDLFGGQRRAVEAADADVEAASADVRVVQAALAADVAAAYLELRAAQQRLTLAEHVVQSHSATLAALRERVAAGLLDRLSLARAEQEAAAATARPAEARGLARLAVRRLELLLGAAPGALDGELRLPAPLPALPRPFAVDVPAAVLARRPDVAAAEARLHAATARVGVATAELYPRFSLTGAFGFQARDVRDLPEYESRFWAIGPQVRWPLFDFGRVRAAIAVQDARAAAALADFEATVQRALADVEFALVRVARGEEVQKALEGAAAAARAGAAIAAEQQQQGVLEYTERLAAERAADAADAELLVARQSLAAELVALAKALGGGWTPAPAAAPSTDTPAR